MSLLSHLAHPHPDMQEIHLHDKKLGGVFLISPWVSFEYDSHSMKANVSMDYIGPDTIAVASRAFIGKSKGDPYSMPITASPEWWQDLPVRHLCFLVGEYEVFRDDVRAMQQIVRVSIARFHSIPD